MVFLLDNYDSFTYNLVQYLGEMGERVEVRRNDQVTLEEIEAMRPQRIVISPGPCTPQDAGISISVIQRFSGKLPILGVCLGHQALGAAFGGQITRARTLTHVSSPLSAHSRTAFSACALFPANVRLSFDGGRRGHWGSIRRRCQRARLGVARRRRSAPAQRLNHCGWRPGGQSAAGARR